VDGESIAVFFLGMCAVVLCLGMVLAVVRGQEVPNAMYAALGATTGALMAWVRPMGTGQR